MTRIRSTAGTVLLATFLVAGSSGALGTEVHPHTAAAAGHTLVFSEAEEPDTLNPWTTTNGNGAGGNPVIPAIFDSLLGVDAHGQLQPQLAISEAHSPDGRTWAFHLRRGVKWADGVPFTSADVAYNYHAIFDKMNKVLYPAGWDQIDRVSTPDAYTFVCHLKAVNAPFLVNVGLSQIIPQHIYDRPGVDFDKTPFNRAPFGTGPYMVKEWKAGDHITLVANPYSWRGQPYFHTILYKIVPDNNTVLVQLRTGELDMGRILQGQIGQARTIPGKRVVLGPRNGYRRVDLPQWGFLREKVVRQALDYATPKQAIFNGVGKGLGAVAYSGISPVLSAFYNPNVPKHPFNLARAAAMLAADGFVKGSDGILEKHGQPFALTLWTGTTDHNSQLTNQVLQQEWGQIGIKITLRTMGVNALFGPSGPYFTKGMIGVTAVAQNGGPDPDDSFYWTSAYIPKTPTDLTCCNYLGYFHRFAFQAQIDALYKAGNSTVDPVERKAIYFQIQDVLADEVPALFLFWVPNMIVVPQNLAGFTANPFYPNDFNDIANWREG